VARIKILLLMLLLCASPSPARADEEAEVERLFGLVLDRLITGQLRVMRVAERMRIDGAQLCGGDVVPVLGLYAADRDSFDDFRPFFGDIDAFFETAETRFGLGDDPRVLAVAPGLPADLAGIRAGDTIVAVDGKKPRMRGDLELKPKQIRDGMIHLSVLRDGQQLPIEVPAKLGCEFHARFMFGTAVNAFAARYGKLTGIYLFGGLLSFASDDELAVVAGHELAHLVRRHSGSGRVSRRFESEADYLGLYFAARSGFDISLAPHLWDRMSRNNPYASIERGFYSHPMSASRSIALAATIDEIEAKRAASKPLSPDSGRFALEVPEVPEAEAELRRDRLRSDALDQFREDQQRVADVSHRLAVAASEWCGAHTGAQFGAIVGRRHDFGAGHNPQIEAAFGADEEVTVFATARNSPAEAALLRKGDRILMADGRRVKKAQQVFDRMRQTDGPVSLRIRRDGQELELEIPFARGCAIGALLQPGSSADTGHHSNRKEMVVSTALMRFVRDDDELAIAIAHQLAHQIEGKFRSVRYEPEADVLGLRIAARAGFDVSKAPAFWDRWAAEQLWKIPSRVRGEFVPHGGMGRRAPVIRETAAAIAAHD